ncbi:MAG: hypothetical protein ACI8PZ_007410 [Myxococcota bacterium]
MRVDGDRVQALSPTDAPRWLNPLLAEALADPAPSLPQALRRALDGAELSRPRHSATFAAMHPAIAHITHLANAVHAVDRQRTRDRLRAIETVAAATRAWLEAERGPRRRELPAAVDTHRAAGTPPPLLRQMGLSDRETPENRVLGWALDPATTAGRSTLLAVARELLPPFAHDLEAGRIPEIRREQRWPDQAGADTQPDLLVIGEGCILLIENKVWSGESGEGQYAGYLAALKRLAAARDVEHTAAWLTARDRRAAPEGWAGAIRTPGWAP